MQERSIATRAGLLALGRERFLAQGYSSTTVENIVAGSPYTRGAFYFHFADKEEFLLEVMRERDRGRGEWWLIADDPKLTTLEQIVGSLLGVFAATDPHGTAWVLVTADFVQNGSGDRDRLAVIREFYEAWIVDLTRFVESLATRGLVRTDRTPRELAVLILAAGQGVGVHAHLYSADQRETFDVVVRILRP